MLNKKDIVFFTTSSEEYMPLALKMRASLLKFHPDIDFYLAPSSAIEIWRKQHPKIGWYANFGEELSKKYKLVIQIDADSVICGKLNELLQGNFELACPKNNGPEGFQETLGNIDKEHYVNAGLVASTSQKFWTEWKERTIKESRQYPYGEQDILNLIFYSGNYKTKLLDSNDKKVFYGCSTNDRYSHLYLDKNKLMLEEKQVKVLHSAGNIDMKLKFPEANKTVQEFIEKLLC